MAEKRIWIAQCLCGPNRHAIAAIAAEAASEGQAQHLLIPILRDGVAELLRSGINPWCAICGAEDAAWRYEVGRTRFRTMEEAAPHLTETEVANRITNALFGSHGPKKPCPS